MLALIISVFISCLLTLWIVLPMFIYLISNEMLMSGYVEKISDYLNDIFLKIRKVVSK